MKQGKLQQVLVMMIGVSINWVMLDRILQHEKYEELVGQLFRRQ